VPVYLLLQALIRQLVHYRSEGQLGPSSQPSQWGLTLYPLSGEHTCRGRGGLAPCWHRHNKGVLVNFLLYHTPALTYTTKQHVCLQTTRLGCARCLLLDPCLHALRAFVPTPTHPFTDKVLADRWEKDALPNTCYHCITSPSNVNHIQALGVCSSDAVQLR